MRAKLIFQYAFMIAVSFICGVISSRYISVDLAENIIKVVDARVLEIDPGYVAAIVPVAISLGIVLLFSSHPFLSYAALIYIALKSVFFGFGSVYMMEQGQSVFAYISWWFPFQLLYLILFICIYRICKVQVTRMKRNKMRAIPVIIGLIAVVLYLEIVVISYVLL